MSLPKDSNGQYYYSIDGVYYRFPQGIDGEIMMAKLQTAQAIVAAVKALATPTDLATDLVAEYFDAGTFADADVAALGITAVDLTNCVTLLENFDKFMTDQAVTPAMNRVTLNKVRRVV
jgi:hypothetical protein